MKLYNYLKKVWRSLWKKKTVEKDKIFTSKAVSAVKNLQNAFKSLDRTIQEVAEQTKAFQLAANKLGLDNEPVYIENVEAFCRLAEIGFTVNQIQSIILNAEDLAANSDLTYEEAEVKAIEVIKAFETKKKEVRRERNEAFMKELQKDKETLAFHKALGIKEY